MSLEQMRARAVHRTLFEAPGLGDAVSRLGFVQADPIRAPAPAQDLILRQRVPDYRAGDLARWYPDAPVEEGLLYAYGTMPRRTWELLRPRDHAPLTELERDVLAAVREAGPLHPRALDDAFGRERARNAWGGHSRVTKLTLERLHRRGLLRVARREKGVRHYQVAPPAARESSAEERLRELLQIVARVLAPVREKTLHALGARLRRRLDARLDHRHSVRALVRQGRLVRETVEEVAYLWPAEAGEDGPLEPVDHGRLVRFLAPFDPLVWDRERFEQLWGWAYRFEAYTPPAERVRGYYAMPLLYGERVIGWANAARRNGGFDVELGFVGARPRGAGFAAAVEEECAQLEAFLPGGRG